jgi:hypothetical protein
LPIAVLPEVWENALAVSQTSRKQVSEGERHDYLRGCAFAMACHGKDVDEILVTLRQRLQFNCEHTGRSVTEVELRSLASSAVAKIAKADQMLARIVA